MLAPPLLVSYSSIDDYLSVLSPEMEEEYGDEIRELVERQLPPVVSSRCLSVLFGYSTKFVNALQLRNHKYYREFTIRKGKKRRKIQAPRVALKVIQKWFGHHLSQALPVENYVYGFVAGRSAVDAAAKHCEASWIYSVDIENFFPSTVDDVVIKALKGIGYSDKGATLITHLCCYGDYLGQGAPSSPVLSNLAMKPVDVQLKAIADDLGITFTRYADDIVFSGKGVFPEELKHRVLTIFDDTCWKLAANKEYLAEADKGQRLKVHGLLVNGKRPKLTKGYRNRIRAYKHLLATDKVKPEDRKRVVGHIKFAESVDNWEK
tara:strand:+ start:3339 stop:4298 length:960 start_codon:yes stop_codon:yes gene_type:complete